MQPAISSDDVSLVISFFFLKKGGKDIKPPVFEAPHELLNPSVIPVWLKLARTL